MCVHMVICDLILKCVQVVICDLILKCIQVVICDFFFIIFMHKCQ
jgi:hypothetical protein